VPSWRPARPPRPWGVALRLIGAATLGFVRAVTGRLVRGPLHPDWGFSFEILAGLQRATWALIPKVGVRRWRDASEMLTAPVARRLAHEPAELGGVAGEWLGQPDAAGPILLYLHGGGYVFGSLDTHRAIVRALAQACGSRALSLDYRLAPEHPLPAACQDACAAYRALLASGVDPARVILGGDSAGGNLTLVTLLALRDAGDPLPAGAVLICPWVDLSLTGESFRRNAHLDYVSAEACALAAHHYVGDRDTRDPEASPLYADLRGLPPLLVQAGGAEVLLDQVREFAERARAAGVETRLSVYDHMIHDWHLFAFLPETKRANEEIGEFARGVAKAAH
jgi:monoterpene epsilon-lactone hydrolase